MNSKKPLGVILLGSFNLFVLGGLSLLVFGYLYFNFSSPAGEDLLSDFRQYLPSQEDFSSQQLRSAIALQMLVSAIFLASGAGLLLRKEWARKLTLYFSFFLAVLTLISVLATPALIGKAFLQLVYPGILIIYFTNKKIENYFSLPRGADGEDGNTAERNR